MAMNEPQRLFLIQARSAYAVFRVISADESLHHCHALHYLQMATELLGKASAWKSGAVGKSHKALVGFLRSLSSNPKAQKQLGFQGHNENWTHTIRKIIPLAENLQKLAPALSNDGPNPEYPWPADMPVNAPTEFDFPIWAELTETAYGRRLLAVIQGLFNVADEFI